MLTADGCQDVAVLPDTGCCPPPLCGNDLCCTFVAFFQLLPSGPMWDYWKNAAISYFNNPENDPAECPLITDPRCPSIVLHAIYTVLKLRHVVHTGLWPAFRESDPQTAVTTLDHHLERMEWEDCYQTACRNMALGPLSPVEIMGVCGPQYCPPPYSDELVCALKRGIARALDRASMGVIKNLCGINWVIEPLGATIMPIYAAPVEDPCPPDPPPEGCDPAEDAADIDLTCEQTDCDPFDCAAAKHFYLCQSRDWLEGCGTGDVCETNVPNHVPAYFEWECWTDKVAGMPDKIWPGVLAAECIIRSLLPCGGANITITRCCEMGEVP